MPQYTPQASNMARLTPILLMATYFILSLSLGAYLWNASSDAGACIAAVIGSFALLLVCHSMITQGMVRKRVEADIERVREAHRLMVDAIDATQKDMIDLADQLQDQRSTHTDELTSEVKMLESLVLKLGDSIEDRLNEWPQPPALATHAGHPPHPEPVVPQADFGRSQGHQPHSHINQSHINQTRLAMIETVREALIDNRVDLYLQPVVSLPQRKTVFYESFSRLRDVSGRIIMPAEYLSVAEPEGLVSSIDNLLLFRCVQIVRRLLKQDRRVGIFCNISLTSLSDEVFFPQFLEFMNDNRDLSSALIFELGQDVFNRRGPVEARNMAKLADLGYRFSIDKVTSIDFDLPDMQRSDVRFVKISAQVLLTQLLDIDTRPELKFLKDIHAEDFARLLSRYGIEVIAEKVESERQVVDVLDVEVPYAQGNLFGEPRAIKEQVLNESDPPPGFIRASMQPRQRRRA
jgi:cyclic-di-GMP phosphodiesterase, flagellum assembly factor TipF